MRSCRENLVQPFESNVETTLEVQFEDILTDCFVVEMRELWSPSQTILFYSL